MRIKCYTEFTSVPAVIIKRERKKKVKKSTKIVLAVALCLCLISGIFASLFMTGFNTVKVQDIEVVVDKGYVING